MAEMSDQEVEEYLKYRQELWDLVGNKAKLEIAEENYLMSFFVGYRNELEIGKEKFVKAIVGSLCTGNFQADL